MEVPDNPTTTKTSSVLTERRALHSTRNKSNTFQRWILLVLRLLEHHEELAEMCFAVDSSVFMVPLGLSLLHHANSDTSCRLLGTSAECRKDTRLLLVRSKLQLKLSGENSTIPQPFEKLTCEMHAMFPLPRRFGWGGKRNRQRRERLTRNGQEPAKASPFSKSALCEPKLSTQYQDVLPRFITFCLESRLLLKTQAQVGSALVNYSNQLFMDGGAASRRHKACCIIDASPPREPESKYSSSPTHGTSSQRVEKSHTRQNKQGSCQ